MLMYARNQIEGKLQGKNLVVCIFCVSHWVRWPVAVRLFVLSGEGRAKSLNDCAVSLHLISPLRVLCAHHSANNLC
jgi:hypothetical protein